MKRLRPIVVTLCVGAVVAVGAPAASAAANDPVRQTEERRCAAPAELPPGADAEASLTWLTNTAAQAAFGRVNEALDRYRAHIFGLVPDHGARRAVLVVDPAWTVPTELRRELRAASARRLPIMIQPGCRSLASLAGVEETLLRRDWHPAAATTRMTFHRDSALGRYVVKLPRSASAQGAALRQRLGDRVAITWGETVRTGRNDDGNPHYGGARITGLNASGQTTTCTAGFTLVRPADGRHFMVTAGHCFGNARTIMSGPKAFGTTSNRLYQNNFDMVLIGSTTQKYDRIIHVDPCCPMLRTVTSKADVGELASVCVSGSFTLAKCDVIVRQINVFDCDATFCFNNLTHAERPGVDITQAGDSGAPIYQPTANSTARIVGMAVFNSGLAPNRVSDDVYFHRVSTIESAYGMVVKTTGLAG